MNFEEFRQSISQASAPAKIPVHLLSLWFDAKGDWNRSHEIIQDIEDTNAAWIHAYLHRKEGDNWNADYWYRKAGRKRPAESLDTEWETIARALTFFDH